MYKELFIRQAKYLRDKDKGKQNFSYEPIISIYIVRDGCIVIGGYDVKDSVFMGEFYEKYQKKIVYSSNVFIYN